MTTRTWSGSSGSWTDPSQWAGGVAPQPGDAAWIAAGTVEFANNASLDAVSVQLAGPASLIAANRLELGNQFTIDLAVPASADFTVAGTAGDAGTIDVASGTLTIANTTAHDNGGALLLLDGAQMAVAGGAVDLTAELSNQATITIGAGGDFINDGTVVQAHAAFEVEAGGTLTGTGAFQIGLYSSLNLQSGAAPSAQNVDFTDVGGRLLLGDPWTYTGTIENFQVGDLIDLTATTADAVSYDASTGVATVTYQGSVVAELAIQGPATATLTTATDGAGGTLIEGAGTQPRVNYTIDGPDQAMQANTARSEVTTTNGTPITGAGVTVGIISTSLDPTQISAAIAAGYLPASGIAVPGGNYGTGDDEGLAMAEEVHQVAPGASIDFASAGSSLTDFANAITALQQAGCQVIVDDVTYFAEPFFQIAGPVDTAIQAAIADGVSYFTAAGNDGNASYDALYAPQPATLYDGTVAQAQIFDNGTPYQTLTLTGGVTTTIALQWAAAYPSGGGTVPDMLSMSLFDANGNLVATSTANASAPEVTLTVTPTVTTQYQLAITGPLTAGTEFKYVLFGSAGGGSTPGGVIDDPAASNAGTVIGHAMLSGVNTIGAIDFAATPAFDGTTSSSFPDYYSASGPGEFLLSSAGSALAAAQMVVKPNLLAPVGGATSVAGFAPFSGTSAAAPNAAAVAALMLQANPHLTPAQISAILDQSALNLGLPASQQGAGLVQAVQAVQLAQAAPIASAACFAEGTRIATLRGPVPVEAVRPGDRVLLVDGGSAPVIWVGSRDIDCAAHPRPAEVWPIRIEAGAMAPGRPERDLFLSPDHAVLLDGVLIPVRYLVNGATVARRPVARIRYFHIELPRHAALLAENLPAESFLDTGNRGAFDGEAAGARGDPADALRRWQTASLAPLVAGGPRLARVRQALLRRARALGHVLTEDAGLQVLVDGSRLAPRRAGRTLRFRLPPGARQVRLRSRVWVPAELGGAADARPLGVAVAGLQLDGAALALGDGRLAQGWHPPEPLWRWTAGDAVIAVAGSRMLAFETPIAGRYWRT